jgi:hypothetical protein
MDDPARVNPECCVLRRPLAAKPLGPESPGLASDLEGLRANQKLIDHSPTVPMQIRTVVGFAEIIEGDESLVARPAIIRIV